MTQITEAQTRKANHPLLMAACLWRYVGATMNEVTEAHAHVEPLDTPEWDSRVNQLAGLVDAACTLSTAATAPAFLPPAAPDRGSQKARDGILETLSAACEQSEWEVAAYALETLWTRLPMTAGAE
jgi:hypothetical protein